MKHLDETWTVQSVGWFSTPGAIEKSVDTPSSPPMETFVSGPRVNVGMPWHGPGSEAADSHTPGLVSRFAHQPALHSVVAIPHAAPFRREAMPRSHVSVAATVSGEWRNRPVPEGSPQG